MKITSSTKGKNYIVKMEGGYDITAFKNLELLKSTISNALKSDSERLILDIQHLYYLNAAVIGIFLGAFTEANSRGREFFLCNVPEKIKRILDLTNMQKVIKYCDNDNDILH
ncbi:MAG: STAS domain-containing protein [Spirochaetes bacterium]|nr:STAS domain-containing protein [Spirochaetota bacterium]